MWFGLAFSSPTAAAVPAAPADQDNPVFVTACSSQAGYFAGDVFRCILQMHAPPYASCDRPVAVSASVQLCGVLSTSASRSPLLDSPRQNRYRHAALPFYRSGEGASLGDFAGDRGKGSREKLRSRDTSNSAEASQDHLPVCPSSQSSTADKRDPIFLSLFSSGSKLLFLSDPHVVADNFVFNEPGITSSFGYECCLPSFLPPTFNGSTTKVNYYLCLTATKRLVHQRAAPGDAQPPPAASTSFLRLPIRLLGSPNRHMPVLPTLGPPVLPPPVSQSAPLSRSDSRRTGSPELSSSGFPRRPGQTASSSSSSAPSFRSRFHLPNVLRVFGGGSISSGSARQSPRERAPDPTASSVTGGDTEPISFRYLTKSWEGGDLAAQTIRNVDPAALDDRFLPECLGSDVSSLWADERRREQEAYYREEEPDNPSAFSSPRCALQETLGLWNASRNTRVYGSAYTDVLCAASSSLPLRPGDAVAGLRAFPSSSFDGEIEYEGCGEPNHAEDSVLDASRDGLSADSGTLDSNDVKTPLVGGKTSRGDEDRNNQRRVSDSATREEMGTRRHEAPGPGVASSVASPERSSSSHPLSPGAAAFLQAFVEAGEFPSAGTKTHPASQDDLEEGFGESEGFLPATGSPASTPSRALLRTIVDGDDDAPFGMPGEASVQRREHFRISRNGQFLCLVSLPGVPFLSFRRERSDSARPKPTAEADAGSSAPCIPLGGSFGVRLSFEGATSRTYEVHLSVVREETPLRPRPSVSSADQAPSSGGGLAAPRPRAFEGECLRREGARLAQVVWEQQEVVVSVEECSLVAHVPAIHPPSFETDTVQVTYALVFQFLCVAEEQTGVRSAPTASLGNSHATAAGAPGGGAVNLNAGDGQDAEEGEEIPALPQKLSRDKVLGLSWELPLIVLPPSFGDEASREAPQEALWVGGGWEAVGDAAGAAAWERRAENAAGSFFDLDAGSGDHTGGEDDTPHHLQLLYSASGSAMLAGDGARLLQRGVCV
ncbi:hypothetical protein BESB_001570 [Besnoitia besnoiti]|uniref:Rgp1 protein n=1 Tax=Besnoitia besnoiti TaxID=94643 RepID=A0A2A9MIK9_BESBE|nr:hypothetical protein BESB_001570 [Besnoitia besnoiti]PFH37815.1 hypothetical protein BESB_001570 [Besnoitia besnoiti]